MSRFILTVIFLFGVAACKGRDKQQLEFNNCLARNCDNSLYSKYTDKGFIRYDTSALGNMSYIQALTTYGAQSYQAWGSFCGCPSGTTPSYHPMIGLGCVQNYRLQQAGYSTVFWALLPGQTHLTEIDASQVMSQVQSGSWGGLGNCVNFMAETCLVNQPDACQNGNVCRPSDLQSGMGFCVKE